MVQGTKKAVYCCDARALQRESCTASPKLPWHGGTLSLKALRHKTVTSTSPFQCRLNRDHHLRFPSPFRKWWLCVSRAMPEISRTAFSLPSAFSHLYLVTSWSRPEYHAHSAIYFRQRGKMASTDRQIPFCKYLPLRAALLSPPHQATFQPVAEPTDERWRNRPAPPAGFARGPRRGCQQAKAKILPLILGLREPRLQRFLQAGFGCRSSYLCHQHRKAGTGNQSRPSKLSLAALGWPSPALGSARQLYPVRSLAQLSALAAKLNLKAKGLYLETSIQDRKESLILFLSPCKRCKELQKGERKTSSPFALLRSPFFNSEVSRYYRNSVNLGR